MRNREKGRFKLWLLEKQEKAKFEGWTEAGHEERIGGKSHPRRSRVRAGPPPGVRTGNGEKDARRQDSPLTSPLGASG